MEEIWRTLWWNTRYEVSNLGRVRNRKTNKILATNPTKSHRHPQVWLYCDYFGETLQYTLSKLVYFTFERDEMRDKQATSRSKAAAPWFLMTAAQS